VGKKEMVGLALVPVLALAERRITNAQVDVLDDLCASLPEPPTSLEVMVFERRYWTVVASATRNALLQTRLRSWLREARELKMTCAQPIATPSEYRQLSNLLRAGVGAVEYWLTVFEPVFRAAESSMRLRTFVGRIS
jgi:hypothetical protein